MRTVVLEDGSSMSDELKIKKFDKSCNNGLKTNYSKPCCIRYHKDCKCHCAYCTGVL